MPSAQTAAPTNTCRGTMRWFLRLLSSIRFDEVLVLQGTPLLGAFFSMGAITAGKCLDVFVLAVASCCLVAHVFLLNDWSGANTDLLDPNRAAHVFTARGIGSRAVGTLCILLLAASLALLAPFGATPLLLALVIAVLSTLYSAPKLAMKGVPLANSVLHLLGGLAHFLLGYSMFHVLDWRGVGIGSFFALTFAAGHLTHEARDCASDALNGIETNAVKFGAARNLVAGFLLFTVADVLLVALAATEMVPRILLLVAVAYPFHLGWTLEAWNAGLGYQNIERLKQRYRALYAIIGVAMALATRLAG